MLLGTLCERMPWTLLEAILIVAVASWILVMIPVLALLYAHGQQLREKRRQLTQRQSSE